MCVLVGKNVENVKKGDVAGHLLRSLLNGHAERFGFYIT